MWLLLTLLSLATGSFAASSTRFTNVECEMLVPAYATYTQCHLKLLGRGIVSLNVYAKLNQGPFNNAKVNLSLWRKYNGYRPFMFNSTFDFCKFMNQPHTKLSFPKIFLDALVTKSNINHTCPYKHDIIVSDLVFKEEFLALMPLPTGQYKFQLMAATNNEWKTIVNVHLSRLEL